MTGPMAMPKPDDHESAGIMRNALVRAVLLLLGGIALVFGIGVIAGLLSAHSERGGAMDARLIGILICVAVAMAGIALFMWRQMRAVARSGQTLNPRERRNRLVLTIAMAVGAAIGFMLALSGGLDGGPGPISLSDAPLPPMIAIGLAAIVAIALPLLSYYWHRRVADELEAAAYREGALMGLYAFWVGAPTWWLLWRGGLVPPPDGVVIYLVVTFVAGVVWLHAKYR